MRSLSVIFSYIKKYPKLVFGYFSLNILSALFSVVSLAMLAPFLTLIFGLQQAGAIQPSRFRLGHLTDLLYSQLSPLTSDDKGKITALAIICIIVVTAIVLKNVFLYCSLYLLTPIRNSIINDMRTGHVQKNSRTPRWFF
jgi:ATP-binding cassette, subfamily B, bacterial MsbA